MKKLILIALLALSLVACDDSPTAPETRLSAGFRVSVAPPPAGETACHLTLTALTGGGKPPYAFEWSLGAFANKYSQRVGTDADASVLFISSERQLGSGTYALGLTVKDKENASASRAGFMSFDCGVGDDPVTREF